MNPYILGAVALAAIGIVTGAYLKGHSAGLASADAKWLAVEAERTTAAAAVLKTVTDRYNASEAANEAKRHEWETADHDRTDKIDKQAADIRKLVAVNGGLFDRGASSCRRSSGDAATVATGTAGSAAAESAGCKLSSELSEFLQSEAARADSAAAYAQLGHDYAVAVEKWREEHRP